MDYYKVDLDGSAYTYGWDGDRLEPGDEVTVPGNIVNPEPSVRRVIRKLDKPDYDPAKIKNILAKTPRNPLADLDDLMDSIFTDKAQNEAIASAVQKNYGYPEEDPSADAGNDLTWAEANPGVVLNYPQEMVRDAAEDFQNYMDHGGYDQADDDEPRNAEGF